MPFDFAERLFDATRRALRVIVTPSDVAPIEIAHLVLFHSKPGAGAFAAARTAEAARKADRARRAAGTAFREATRAMAPVRVAEDLKLRAEAQLAAAETAVGSAVLAEAKEQAEAAKAQVVARIAELQAQWAAAKAELQPKLDAVTAAREAAVVTETARVAAAEAARQVARELEPVSVLISRKTQRLYVRQAFEPIFQSPSRSWMPIVRLARMSSPPSSGRPATPTCDGASSHWTADVRPAERLSQTAVRAGAVVATLSRCRRTRTAQRPRSIALSFRRTHWIASPGWRRDLP
jgi:hypothetical protein